MANLTADKRKGMPSSEFAGPGKSFPVNDKEHARLAIGGATRSERAGNISASTADKIKARARKKLGKSRPPEEGERQMYSKGTSCVDPDETQTDSAKRMGYKKGTAMVPPMPKPRTKTTKGPIPQGTLSSMVQSLRK